MGLGEVEPGELATLPRLWSAAVIKKIRFRSFQLQQFFAVRRFNHISSLDFSRIQLGEESVRQLLHWSLTSHLESLDLTGLNLSQVPSDLLSLLVMEKTPISCPFLCSSWTAE